MAALDLGDLGFKITVETGEFDRAMGRVEQAARKVDKQLDNTGKKKLSVKADGGQLDKLQSSARDAAGALDQVGSKRVAPSVETGGLGQVKTAAAEAAGSMGELNSHAGETGSVFSGAAGGIAKFVGAAVSLGSIATAAKAVASAGMDFQSQMNTLSAVSGATGAQLAAVGTKARELGTDASLTATSASDAAAAMTELAKGGFTVEQSMTAAKGTLQLAAAAQVEAADAATIQSQALQAFNLGADEAARVSDILAGAANASSAEMTGIAQGLQQAGTVANQFGLTIDDTATSLAMLANAGIQGSDAGTLLKSAMLALTDQGKPAQAAIEELGLTVYDANGKFVGMSDLLGQLKSASESMTEEQYQAATAVLFGSDAMRLAGVAAVQGSEGFDTLKEAVTRQGQAAEVAAAQTQGLPGVWERVQNTMEDLSLGVFDQVDDQLVRMGNGAVDALDAAAPKIEAFASSMAGLAGTSMDGLGKTVELWGKLPGPVKDTAVALGAVNMAMKLLRTERGANAVTKLAESFANTKSSLKIFGSSMSEAYGYMRQANPEMSRAGAAMRVLGGQGGVAAAGMSKLKAAGMGVMDMFGGPWGIALAAATAVITDVIAFNRRASQAQEDYKDATRSAAEAQERLNSALAGTHAPFTKEQFEDAKLVAEGYTASIRMNGETMAGWRGEAIKAVDVAGLLGSSQSKAWQETIKQAEIMGEASLLTGDALKAQGKDWEDLGEIVARGGQEYKDVIAQLNSVEGHWWNDQGEAAQKAVADLESARHEYEMAIDAARSADPAFQAIGESIGVLADEAASAEDKLSALKRIMDEMSGGALSKDQAQAALVGDIEQQAEQVEALAKAVAEVGPIELDPDGTIDATTSSGAKAVSMITELGDSMAEAAVAGVDVDEIFALQADNMEGLRNALGLTEEQFQNLMQSYGITREVLALPLEMKGADTVEQQIAKLETGLAGLKEGNSVEIAPPDPAVVLALEDMGYKIEHLPNGNIEITSTADVNIEELDDLHSKVDEIDGLHAKATAELDTTEFGLNAEQARAIGEELDGLDVSPEADLIIEKLLQGKDVSVGELNMLSQEKAVPTADLEKSLLDAGVSDALVKTANLGEQRPTPKSDMDNSSFMAKARAMMDMIGMLTRPMTTTVTFVGRKVGQWLSREHGGQIPALAIGGNTGYRLPGTGPGTNIVDGFMGVTDDGFPIARVNRNEWVINDKSSEKFNGTLAAINANDPRGIMANLAHELPALETGGRTKSEEVKSILAPYNNGPYVMGGFSPSSFDCSGAVSAGVNTYLGLDPFDSRMSTVNEGAWLAAKGFKSGRGNGNELVVGWYDYGGGANGHTAMMLPDGTFIESGGNTGQGMTIGGAAGPLDGRGFTNFMYLPGSDKDSGNGMTGDLGETDGYGTDIGDIADVAGGGARARASWKNVSAPEAGKTFHAPGLASNRVTATVGGSLGAANRAQARQYADQYGVPQSMVDQAFGFANPFVGQNSYRQTLGEPATKQILGIAKQLEGALGKGGIAAQVEAALNAKTPNWDVWLRVNEDTLAAFNELGEAQTNRKNASMEITEAEEKLAELRKNASKSDKDATEKLAEAYKNLEKAKSKELTKSYTAAKRADDIEKAEKKIRDLKEKADENDVKSAQRIAEAEQDLVEARQAEKEAIAEVNDAQIRYNAALTVAPIKAAASLADTLAEGMGRVADTMGLMAENMDRANKVADERLEAELADVQAKRGAVDAAQALRELERQNQQARHDDVLAQQQAEYDLAMARHEHAQNAGSAEIDLAGLRQKGILDVAQRATDADRVAMLSASSVAVAEMNLDASRAASAEAEFNRKVAVEEATADLNYSQEIAKLTSERLSVATMKLAQSAAEAAGVLGNSASALAKEQEGKQKQAKGAAGILGGIAQLGAALAMTVATGGAALPAALALGVRGLGSLTKGATSVAEGRAQEKAYKEQAKKEYDSLSKDDKRRVDTARGGLAAGVVAGALVGAAGGSGDDVAGMFDATSGLFNLPLYKKQMTAKYGAEAAELLAAKAEADINRRRKKLELDKARRDLNRVNTINPRKNELAEMAQTLKQQLAELQQENSQLAGVNNRLDTNNSLLDDKKRSVLMTLGGSGWGQDLEAGMRAAASAGGFGGVTRDEVGEWSSLNVEQGWRNLDKMRALVEPTLAPKDTAADAAAANGLIEGLPETAVGGRYARQLADSVVEGAQQAAQRSAQAGMEANRRRAYEDAAQAVLTQIGGAGDTTRIDTQFTGAVTVNAKLEDKVLSGLSSMVKNR
ncbi:phage tail tape measure protein [Corynebacterium aurimucosum]|uniref:NlpC/P60 domain-containing protein n=1 Tax=Corynebacterium aurimucosum (strain ATCC 700975 / DSM 44827 / CIP 107346 / CN-1) TaxID=548476 RepID=C3PIB5_CORA7|nr:phage tail tape measure protein [Corynebacterium aurimucosum]ACP33569.1 hypothetical protein cauri_1976 [Corynebacterium aurimucosum ATCC 700975]QQU92318.1 phage tail tape measure protein [Corynebacterium aurimucosum]